MVRSRSGICTLTAGKMILLIHRGKSLLLLATLFCVSEWETEPPGLTLLETRRVHRAGAGFGI